MKRSLLIRSLSRGLRTLCSRKIYITMMIVVPVLFTFFFTNMMSEGLPLKVPTGVVDLDDSQLSHRVVRNLSATELLAVDYRPDSYHQALEMVRSGKIYGFFLIPNNFQRDALNGNGTTITYYSNLTYFVPGSLAFKGFKTMAVTTAGGIVQTTLTSVGIDPATVGSLLQPVVISNHPIGNPWTNYNIYLSQSFIPAMLALLILLVTCFSICEEIKRGTSPEWLRTGGGSMGVAIVGKLLPQTLIWIAVGLALQYWLFGLLHFPLHNHALHMICAMVLLVVSCQSLALIVTCAIPNMRLALSVLSLVGILSFSVAGFSFPVQSMYGSIGIFSYILPIRYYFLIYIDQALNGIPLYFSRWYYVALLIFPLVAIIGLPRLKKHCINPIYVP